MRYYEEWSDIIPGRVRETWRLHFWRLGKMDNTNKSALGLAILHLGEEVRFRETSMVTTTPQRFSGAVLVWRIGFR